jgi:hypothetical protein
VDAAFSNVPYFFHVGQVCYYLQMTKENSSNEEWFGEVLKICDSFLSKVILCDEPGLLHFSYLFVFSYFLSY